MDKEIIKCYNQDHSNIEAIYYCFECKIYMCKKCQNFHSKLCHHHHEYSLEKNISEIFTGFCKEENHSDKLEYYCKSHNELCCSGCIAKIKRKDKGQHSDCEICLIEDIKENKENTLKENISNLEKLSEELEKLINELKIVFEKISKDKEELKLNIQKIFTKIRNSINNREDEILLNVDTLFDNVYMKEKDMNDIDKYPNKIKNLLKQGKNTIDQWKNNNENELSSLINDCINIEKNLININNIEQNLKKCKNEMSSIIEFNPSEGNELNNFISNISDFGKLYKKSKEVNIEKNKEIEQKIKEPFILDFEIKSDIQSLNKFSIQLKNFTSEEYNNYYPNNVNFKDNEIVFSFQIKTTKKYIEEIIKNKNYYEDICDKLLKCNLSLRKRENILFVDLKNKEENKGILSLINAYEYILNRNEISMKFQNNLEFEKFKEMDLKTFISLFLTFVFAFKINLKNLENSLISLKQSNIEEKEKNKIYEFIVFLLLFKVTNCKIDISSEKILEYFKLKKIFEDIPFKKCEDFIKDFIIPFAAQFSFYNLHENLNFNKIIVTLLFGKFKSGFVLEINTKGINEYLKEIETK